MNRIIGMIVPDVDNSFFSGLVKEAGRIVRSWGDQMLVYDSQNRAEAERLSYGLFSGTGVSGILSISGLSELEDADLPGEIPIVWVDRRPASKKMIPWVANDDEDAMEQAAELLISKGCRNILLLPGFIAENQESPRVKGFRSALKRHGLPCRQDYILNRQGKRGTELEAEELVQGMIRRNLPLDGIITSSDRAAFGALTALRSVGLYVPEDVKLISFDNSVYSSLTSPAITSLDRNPGELAAIACDVLQSLMDGKTVSAEYKAEVSLIERDSTR